jgi:phosphatidylglycerophosphatase A
VVCPAVRSRWGGPRLDGLGGAALFLAWVVFRIADASKRFPGVAAAERLPGAVGVTADDVVAGLWALAAGWVFTLLV